MNTQSNRNRSAVVITTVNRPDRQILKWKSIGAEKLIVIGDKKTPEHEWKKFSRTTDNFVIYVSCKDQETMFPDLSKALGWNTYARKNIGYLYAKKLNFTTIIESDDDTFPRDESLEDLSSLSNGRFDVTHEVLTSEQDLIWNPYSHFAKDFDIWPRGYPLEKINSVPQLAVSVDKSLLVNEGGPQIIQFLVNGEPDLDAIYRLTRKQIEFDFPISRDLVRLSSGSMAPGNTQATYFLNISNFDVLYFPSTISPRVADILKLYVAQLNTPLTHGGFSFVQRRNPHDFFDDFLLELEMYKNCSSWIEALADLTGGQLSVFDTYSSLCEWGLIPESELQILSLYIAETSSPV